MLPANYYHFDAKNNIPRASSLKGHVLSKEILMWRLEKDSFISAVRIPIGFKM